MSTTNVIISILVHSFVHHACGDLLFPKDRRRRVNNV